MSTEIFGAFGRYDKQLAAQMLQSLAPECDQLEQNSILLAKVKRRDYVLPEESICRDEKLAAVVDGELFAQNTANYNARALVGAWSQRKSEATQLLDGAFSSALFDSNNAELYLLNDYLGQMPLYYSSFHGAFYFSSSLKPFLRAENFPRVLDPYALELYFSYGCIPGTHTVLAGVQKLPPAGLARVDLQLHLDLQQYWNMQQIRTNSRMSLQNWSDSIFPLIQRGVQKRLEPSKRPLGVFLGGLDSSFVAMLLRRLTTERILGVTAQFEDPRFNERFPAKVAELGALELKEIPVRSKDMPQAFLELAQASEDLMADMIACPVAFVLAKKTLGQVGGFFDGTGADDLFQGIPHPRSRTELVADSLPSILREGLRRGAGRVKKLLGESRMPSRLSPSHFAPPLERELGMWKVGKRLLEEGKQILLSKEETGTRLGRNPLQEVSPGKNQGARTDHIALKTAVSLYFLPTHGFDVSRNRAIARQFGVKVQTPFYERSLYELGLSIPWKYKLPSAEALSKPLLRKVALEKKLLPAEVVLQKKMGLGSSRVSLRDTQVSVWMKEAELSGWVQERITDSLDLVPQILNKHRVQQVIANSRPQELFLILMFLLWYRAHFLERKELIRVSSRRYH